MVVCLATAAVLIPTAAHLPRWIEFELVLGAWWVIWALTLSCLLFFGHFVEDDATFWRPSADSESVAALGCIPDAFCWGCLSLEGCVLAAAAVVALVVLFGFVLPGIAFALYLTVRGMLARVTNPHCHCEDKPLQAMMWGFIWATVYNAPVAVVVWAVHALSQKPA